MPDTVSTQALGALQAAVSSLLPGEVPAGLTRSLAVVPRAISPLGLGGFVGSHVAPDAALFGRRVRARVDVGVAGGADATAAGYLATLSGQMQAFTRAEFAGLGIHRLAGVDGAGERALAFDIDFEFVPLPDAGEGLIQTLALESYTNLTPYRTRLLADFAGASLALAVQPLADFIAIDDAGAAPPGVWSVAVDAIQQSAATADGAAALADPVKAGSTLLWRPGGVPFTLRNFVLSVVFDSPGGNGVGLVFGRTAADERLFFLAHAGQGYHLVGQRTPTGWQTLASAPAGYDTTRSQRLVLTLADGRLEVDLDDRRTLAVDGLPQLAGEIGLLTHGNATARFVAGRVMALE